MAEKKKLLAEAVPEEIKTILGWHFNFRELIVYLPENKYVTWNCTIKGVLISNKTNCKELETILGRMVRVGIIVS